MTQEEIKIAQNKFINGIGFTLVGYPNELILHFENDTIFFGKLTWMCSARCMGDTVVISHPLYEQKAFRFQQFKFLR